MTQVLWIILVPVLILAGALDRWVSAAPGVAARFVGDGEQFPVLLALLMSPTTLRPGSQS